MIKKRLICVIFALSLLLCACAEEAPDYSGELNSALEQINSETRLAADYMLEITFGNRVTLFYAKGGAAWDRAALEYCAEFDQTYLGLSVEAANYASGGKLISVSDGEEYTEDIDIASMLAKFPYAPLPSYSIDYGSMTKGENSTGITYSYTRTDGRELAEILVGGDIYSLVTALKKPQPEKTVYGPVSTTVTLKDGAVDSCRFEFDMKLFDTPSTVEGYTQPESEYTIDIHVVAKVTYTDRGDSVEVKRK